MVLGGNNDTRRAGLFGYSAPLSGIKISGIKNIFRLISMSPFFIRECIGAKMGKEVEFLFMPLELPWGWLWLSENRLYTKNKY